MINSLKRFLRFDAHQRVLRRRTKRGALRLLVANEFRQEVQTERMRADRRGIPFCVLKLTLRGASRSKAEMKRLVGIIVRNVRATDEKGLLSRYVLGLLLVDTPEMGGRTVADRLEGVCLRAGFDIQIALKTYDPNSFSEFDGPAHDDETHADHSDFNGAGGTGRQFRPLVATGVVEFGSAVATEPALVSLSTARRVRIDDTVHSDLMVNDAFEGIVKRSLDLVVAGVGLVVVSPILIAAMAAIKVTSEGPALFVQVREGRSGRPFKIYKLRTMYIDAEARQASLRVLSERDGPAFKMKNDPRVTRIGKFLRSTCIDELPQLINVLKGDMSIVGPRPLPLAESRACAAWHRRRLDVRPGLTCDWQINKQAAETFDDWMRLDLAYVDRGGVIRDLWLMVQTLRVPMGGRGGD